MRFAAAVVFAFLLAGLAIARAPLAAAGRATTPAAATTSCEDLARVALPHAKIESAESIAAGAFVPPARGAEAGAAGSRTDSAPVPGRRHGREPAGVLPRARHADADQRFRDQD